MLSFSRPCCISLEKGLSFDSGPLFLQSPSRRDEKGHLCFCNASPIINLFPGPASTSTKFFFHIPFSFAPPPVGQPMFRGELKVFLFPSGPCYLKFFSISSGLTAVLLPPMLEHSSIPLPSPFICYLRDCSFSRPSLFQFFGISVGPSAFRF